MPRKTKEIIEDEKTTKTSKTTKTAKNTKTTKKATVKKEPTKKATPKKTTTKKTTTKKESNKKAVNKTVNSRKTTKKATTTKNKKTTNSKTKKETFINNLEYYDLPYRYNQTIVKILAQTPNTLFIYWDISDTDRKNLETNYGNNFFEASNPVLIIHNETKNYTFEIEINDFANSWYLHLKIFLQITQISINMYIYVHQTN